MYTSLAMNPLLTYIYSKPVYLYEYTNYSRKWHIDIIPLVIRLDEAVMLSVKTVIYCC